jgi:Flp pilus assembly protein TadD
VEVFLRQFSAEAFQTHFGPIEQARAQLKAKRHESALALFTQALTHQPDNWALLTEIADFLAYTTHDYEAALRAIDDALQFNPWWSEAWNTRGDCLYYLERHDEAHAAFEQALKLKPRDVRALYNLSYTRGHRGDLEAALTAIAEGLANDTGGKYRERLLDKQREILSGIDEQRRAEERFQVDRLRPAPAPG